MNIQGDSGTWGSPKQMNDLSKYSTQQTNAYKQKTAWKPTANGQAMAKGMMTRPQNVTLKQKMATKMFAPPIVNR